MNSHDALHSSSPAEDHSHPSPFQVRPSWNGKPFPTQAERLVLPSERVLEDAVIWPRFLQSELGMDPSEILNTLMELPSHADNKTIAFHPDGGAPRWINGSHPALHLRGHALRRAKLWFQTEYEAGLRKYGYPGWQNRIVYATHSVESAPVVEGFLSRLNHGLVRSGHLPHNHVIVTRYQDEDDEIGFHSDRDKDFAPGSYFIVVKLGSPRPFAFRLSGLKNPFYARDLEAGTAIFVRCKAPGAANNVIQHGVPRMTASCGLSGSIVTRCIQTLIPWEVVHRRVSRSRYRR